MKATELKKLIDTVTKDGELTAFSNELGKVTKQTEGYVRPTENWVMEGISKDLYVVTDRINREKYLSDWYCVWI